MLFIVIEISITVLINNGLENRSIAKWLLGECEFAVEELAEIVNAEEEWAGEGEGR